MKTTRNLNKKEQKAIVKKTDTNALSNNIGFQGSYMKNGKQCGGGIILRSDGKYHDESLEELEKQGIFAI